MADFSPQAVLEELKALDQRANAARERLAAKAGPIECGRSVTGDEFIGKLTQMCTELKSDEDAKCLCAGILDFIASNIHRLEEDPVEAQKRMQLHWSAAKQALETACLPALERYVDKLEGKPAMSTAVEVAKKAEESSGDTGLELRHPPMLSLKYALIIGAVLVVLVLIVWWFHGKGSSTSSNTSVSQSSTVSKQNFGNPPTAYTRS